MTGRTPYKRETRVSPRHPRHTTEYKHHPTCTALYLWIYCPKVFRHVRAHTSGTSHEAQTMQLYAVWAGLRDQDGGRIRRRASIKAKEKLAQESEEEEEDDSPPEAKGRQGAT